MSIHITNTRPRMTISDFKIVPDDSYCNVESKQCVKIPTGEERMTTKYCQKICTAQLMNQSLELYFQSKTCAEHMTLVYTKYKKSKMKIWYTFWNDQNKPKKVDWEIDYCKAPDLSASIYFFEHTGIQFSITIKNDKSKVSVHISSFFYKYPYDNQKEQYKPEELFFMIETISMGFAEIDKTKIVFQLEDNHSKHLIGYNKQNQQFILDMPSYIINFFMYGSRYYENKGFKYVCSNQKYDREQFLKEAIDVKNMLLVDFLNQKLEIKEENIINKSLINKLKVGDFIEYFFTNQLDKVYETMEAVYAETTPNNINSLVKNLVQHMITYDCSVAKKMKCILTDKNVFHLSHFQMMAIDLTEPIYKTRDKRVIKWIKKNETDSLIQFVKNGDEFNFDGTVFLFSAGELVMCSLKPDLIMFKTVLPRVNVRFLKDEKQTSEICKNIIRYYNNSETAERKQEIEYIFGDIVNRGFSPFFRNNIFVKRSDFITSIYDPTIKVSTIKMILRYMSEDHHVQALFQQELFDAARDLQLSKEKREIIQELIL